MNDHSEAPAVINIISDKDGVKETVALSGKNTFKIGRGDANEVILKHSWVSRQHAMIQVEENGAFNIIDLGSSNGTTVNGKRIYTPIRLRSGDLIGIGKTSLAFFQNMKTAAPLTSPDEDTDEKTVAFVNKEIVTVLICDIHGFTRLSETIGDSLMTRFLQAWATKINAIVKKNNGIIDKYIGDAVMAMWTGGPNHRYNIHQALVSILMIDKVTQELSHEIPGIPWELCIGAALNTGEAIVGTMGGDGRRDFTVIGDAINVAFRLEEMTSQGSFDILMGQETARHLKNADQFFTATRFLVKGKEERVLAYGCTFGQLTKYLNQKKDSSKK